ncbi:MAG: DUF5606 domain-containing protein [Bacteroidota bacterium]
MDLKEIVAIAGISGLHKIIGRSKNGLILETMSEPKKRFATGMHDKVSVLEDISMYTIEGDVQLAEVFVKLNDVEKAGNAAPSSKDDSKAQRAYVNTAVKLDNERVYDSDIKKLITWYNLLKGQLDFAALLGETAAETTEDKPKKTSKKAKADDAEEAATEEAKPKKVAAKKTAAKAPKTAAPKDMNTKVSSKGAGNKNTYRPKSV